MKKRKGNETMGNRIWIAVFVIIVAAVLVVAVIISAKKKSANKPKTTGTAPQTYKTKRRDEEREATDAEHRQWEQYYMAAARLKQEMASLAFGNNGMVMQRMAYEGAQNPALAEEYRMHFLRRQERLREAYAEYNELKAKADQLPESAGERIPELDERERYEELLTEALS